MTTWLAHPEALWLLALLPALGLLGLWSWRRQRRALALLGGGLALHRLTSAQRGPRLLSRACLGLGLLALVAGVAGPQWERQDVETARGRDLVVVLDLSRSMLAEQPSRQERALKALRDLADAVQRRGGHRLALVAFATHARVVCPLTHDYDHFRNALDRQDAAEPPPDIRPRPGDAASGTRIGEALRLAVSVRDPNFPGGQDILLVSDGDDPAGDGEWAKGAAAAHKARVPVHAVGVGDPERSYPIPVEGSFLRHDGKVVETGLHEQPLEEIARRTGGVYIPAQTRPLPLGRWLREVIEPRKAARPDEEDVLPVYRQQYPWFLGPALALLALPLLFGDGRAPPRKRRGSPDAAGAGTAKPAPAAVPALLALALLAVAAAPAAQDLVRQGNAAYDAEQFEEAVEEYGRAEERTTDPGLVAFNKAAALYRLGRYREAELHYRRCLDDATGPRRARALYDLGNCLLQQARDRDLRLLEQSVACYRTCRGAAGASPALRADAAHNLELARLLWLKARASGAEESPRSEDDPGENSHKPEDAGKAGSEGAGDPDDPQGGQPGKEKQGAEDMPGAERKVPTPGRGTLPTLPDSDELVPLPPDDTAAYLERLAERIRRERREHWRAAAPAVPNVKDW
jgi:Ca-activated chloride channel family protein